MKATSPNKELGKKPDLSDCFTFASLCLGLSRKRIFEKMSDTAYDVMHYDFFPDADTLDKYCSRGFPQCYCKERYSSLMDVFLQPMDILSQESATVCGLWEQYKDIIIVRFKAVHDDALGNL